MEVEVVLGSALRRARTIVLITFFNKMLIVAAAVRVGHQPGTPLHQSHALMNLERTSQPAARLAPFYQTEFGKLTNIPQKGLYFVVRRRTMKPATMVHLPF